MQVRRKTPNWSCSLLLLWVHQNRPKIEHFPGKRVFLFPRPWNKLHQRGVFCSYTQLDVGPHAGGFFLCRFTADAHAVVAGMKITTKVLVRAFESVRNVQDTISAYCLAPDKTPVGLDDIATAIREGYAITIEYAKVPLMAQHVRAILELYPQRALISLSARLDAPSMRYACAKEMAQIILKNGENTTQNPIDLIEYMIVEHVAPHYEPAPPAAEVEYLAMYVAVELLFPFKLRTAQKAQLQNGDSSSYQLASHYDLPEYIVEFALSDLYMGLATKIWDEIAKVGGSSA